jgi:septal ring factor EnvC (AmiA/AmiB activator)
MSSDNECVSGVLTKVLESDREFKTLITSTADLGELLVTIMAKLNKDRDRRKVLDDEIRQSEEQLKKLKEERVQLLSI